MYDRKNCPVCHIPMDYAFPSVCPDKAVDGLLWRFQVCRNVLCNESMEFKQTIRDVITREKYHGHYIRGKGLEIEGKLYKDTAAWVRSLKLPELEG